ncbi:AAA family ATPase [Sphingobacterium bovistauri]|uniref:ATP-binding protein n=1 Tax=Sphingobacterium bovistauri TaxID=2781959 RepID=A0ABS7Z4W2_9SPHI|nr:ATP-binding protein [Sphingobacterium bovistauri]MCA5005179.1 ATP-binding protein [Sphingobacterium bovistauri]
MSHSSNSFIKIAVVGPESTGKSTMANYLSKELNTFCVPEYARYYCENLNKQYTLEDEINMFHGQRALETAISSNIDNNILICDTTILTVKIWCDHLFHYTPPIVLQEITKRKYDLYLLMDIDLPWEDDLLRDFPNERQYFMKIWKEELGAIQANYQIISGLGDERLKYGLKICQEFIRNSK